MKILAAAVLALYASAASATATWSATASRSAKVVCSTGTETFAKAVTDGVLLDVANKSVEVHLSADSGQTLSGAGTLQAWLYNAATTRWSRAPGLDITTTASAVRDVAFSAEVYQGPTGQNADPSGSVGQSRIAFMPSGITVSSGGVTIYLNGNAGVGGASGSSSGGGSTNGISFTPYAASGGPTFGGAPNNITTSSASFCSLTPGAWYQVGCSAPVKYRTGAATPTALTTDLDLFGPGTRLIGLGASDTCIALITPAGTATCSGSLVRVTP